MYGLGETYERGDNTTLNWILFTELKWTTHFIEIYFSVVTEYSGNFSECGKYISFLILWQIIANGIFSITWNSFYNFV